MHDPLILTARGGIPLHMAKPARAKEPGHAAEELERLGIPVLGTIEGDAYADGGDRFWLDDSTMAVGLGYRTNRQGASALQALVAPEGIHVETYDMPHDQGPDHVLHLQSFLSAATEDLYVVFEPLAPVRLLQDLRAAASTGSPSTRRAISPWAATCSPSAPASSSWASPRPRSAQELEAKGVEVHTYATPTSASRATADRRA